MLRSRIRKRWRNFLEPDPQRYASSISDGSGSHIFSGPIYVDDGFFRSFYVDDGIFRHRHVWFFKQCYSSHADFKKNTVLNYQVVLSLFLRTY
jgi:hypothetical protein